jgi:hypothetical protein
VVVHGDGSWPPTPWNSTRPVVRLSSFPRVFSRHLFRRGKISLSGQTGPRRSMFEVKAALLGLIGQATSAGWSLARACRVLGLSERRARPVGRSDAGRGGCARGAARRRSRRSSRWLTSGARSTARIASSRTAAPTWAGCGSHRPRCSGERVGLREQSALPLSRTVEICASVEKRYTGPRGSVSASLSDDAAVSAPSSGSRCHGPHATAENLHSRSRQMPRPVCLAATSKAVCRQRRRVRRRLRRMPMTIAKAVDASPTPNTTTANMTPT